MPTFAQYGLNWPQGTDPLLIEMHCIKKGGVWSEKGQKLGMGLSFHYEQMRKLIWPHLDDHRWHHICRDEIFRPGATVTVLMGPGSCVIGSTKLLDPTTGKNIPIQELCEAGIRPTVMTIYGPKLAQVPFLKGRSKLLKITLKSGRTFTSTPGHQVLTDCGFRPVSSLRIGQPLLAYAANHQRSTLEPGQQWSFSSVRNLLKTAPDFQSDCLPLPHFCDEPLPVSLTACQDGPPQPAYAQEHKIWMDSEHLDALGHRPKRTHSCQLTAHLSSLDAFRLDCRTENDALPRAFLKNFLHDGDSFLPPVQSWLANIHPEPFSKPDRGFSHSYLDSEKTCQNFKVRADVVQSISDAGIGNFYDLQVPDYHHYFADGTIHHNSGKTHESSWTYLCEYFCFPQETCVLVSSTDMRGLRLRVWGEIAMLWDMAIKRYDWLPGHLLDSKLAITTDSLDDGDIDDRAMRDMRKGLIGIPTVQNGKFIGLGKWVGIKQKRVRLIADEASMMGSTFLSAFANLNKNENFQAIVLGNPNDPLDPLGKAAEPKDGWSDEYLEPDKTSVWDTRFMNGRCVNLIGLDSPNMDFPADQPTKYRYLISRKKIDETLSFFPKDSVEYYSQCVGSMKIGTMAKRVIDRKTCLKFNAFDDVIWAGNSRITKIAALDASYGGDRCALTLGEFGMNKDNRLILSTSAPVIVPISVKSNELPEDQISLFCRSYCEKNGVEPGNFFHDSTGRGTLGTSLARTWSNECNPVEFGGSPSERPVTLDWYIDDPETGIRRLKLASEHYAHFVDELWYSVRYAIEGDQMRNLPHEVMEEGALRMWDNVKNKIRLETKVEMKERVGRSPDLFDSLAILVEGARRRGFGINKLSNKEAKTTPKTTSFHREAKALAELSRKRVLQAA